MQVAPKEYERIRRLPLIMVSTAEREVNVLPSRSSIIYRLCENLTTESLWWHQTIGKGVIKALPLNAGSAKGI